VNSPRRALRKFNYELADQLATSPHMDGQHDCEKVLVRFGGWLNFLELKSDCFTTVVPLDCSKAARATCGTSNAVCGDGNKVRHAGGKDERFPSVVLQIIRTDKGDMTQEDCIKILRIIEYVVEEFFTSRALRAILDRLTSVFGGAETIAVETGAEAVETETETESESVGTESVETVETVETDVVDMDPAKVGAVEDQEFDWLKICTRKSDDTEPTEIELGKMKSFFPKLRHILFNLLLPKLRFYAPTPESRLMDDELMLRFGWSRSQKRLTPRNGEDPTFLRGTGFNRNTDMMFVLGGNPSLRAKFTKAPGGQAYWRLFDEAHREYLGAIVGNPEKDKSSRECIAKKLALDFYNATGGWFFSLQSDTITQYSCNDVLIRITGYLADADSMSLAEKTRTHKK
jgi:hypothetical protein